MWSTSQTMFHKILISSVLRKQNKTNLEKAGLNHYYWACCFTECFFQTINMLFCVGDGDRKDLVCSILPRFWTPSKSARTQFNKHWFRLLVSRLLDSTKQFYSKIKKLETHIGLSTSLFRQVKTFFKNHHWLSLSFHIKSISLKPKR